MPTIAPVSQPPENASPETNKSVDRDLFGEPIVAKPPKRTTKAPVIQFPTRPMIARGFDTEQPTTSGTPSPNSSETTVEAKVYRSDGTPYCEGRYTKTTKGKQQGALRDLFDFAATHYLKAVIASGIIILGIGGDTNKKLAQPTSQIPTTAAPTTSGKTTKAKRPHKQAPRKSKLQLDDEMVIEQLNWLSRTSTTPSSPSAVGTGTRDSGAPVPRH